MMVEPPHHFEPGTARPILVAKTKSEKVWRARRLARIIPKILEIRDHSYRAQSDGSAEGKAVRPVLAGTSIYARFEKL